MSLTGTRDCTNYARQQYICTLRPVNTALRRVCLTYASNVPQCPCPNKDRDLERYCLAVHDHGHKIIIYRATRNRGFLGTPSYSLCGSSVLANNDQEGENDTCTTVGGTLTTTSMVTVYFGIRHHLEILGRT